MRLTALARHWERYAEEDPLWAVLTDPDQHRRQWSLDAFMATGAAEVTQLKAVVERAGLTFGGGNALDFGCGVGRVTLSLADHFTSVHGVDLSQRMVGLARDHASRYSRHPDRCVFTVNRRPSLHGFHASMFRLVYSRLVLQHMTPRYIRRYVEEFCRVLAPGGALVFQLPERIIDPPRQGRGLKNLVPWRVVTWVRAYRRWRFYRRQFPRMESWGLDRPEVEHLLARAGVRLAAAVPDQSHGTDRPGYLYMVTR